jgi:ABC-type polysaccharide/polyol phosphate transport system ATPase subunit
MRLEKRPTLKKAVIQGRRALRSAKEFWALRDVSLELQRGETLGVIGPNGSGKSTLLRTVGGIYKPDQGRIKVNGHVSTLLSLTAGFQSELTGRENIRLVGMFMGFSLREIGDKTEEIIDFAELGAFINAPVKTYSSGMVARLGFAIASYLDCDILLVDEILGVGDQSFRQKSQVKIRELVSEQRTVLLVSHNLEAIREYSTKVLWLDHGSVQAYGEPSEVIEAYKAAV